MRILVACEYSGTVRDAFARLGHDAWSCDILPTDKPGQHIQGDVIEVLGRGWDMMIAHPPCTYLCNSGVRWLDEEPGRWQKMKQAAEFFCRLWAADIPHIAIENPIMHGHAQAIIKTPPTQIIHPWEHGHGETKATCLWLRGLPQLCATDRVAGREARLHQLSPSADRWKIRSKTFDGIAEAMAQQWSAPSNYQLELFS